MKEIKVKDISDDVDTNCFEKVSVFLDTLEREKLECILWPEFAAKPTVSFTIAHDVSNIFLKYFVEEKFIRAQNNTINSPVHEDSCVEFFVSFDEGATYYNMEFNCIGTAMVGYGPSKNNRKLLDSSLVKNLKRKSIITSENDKGSTWQLTLAISLSTFIYTSIHKLQGLTCRANFFKCGDLLPEPHFISWSDIKSEKPNFHLSEFFGRLVFE
ncbi:MAG: carbohydrate-binding family 9-like protein [Ginsengibacter sp.]